MDHKLILETLNKYQWQKKEWNYKEATQSYYSFSNRKVALLSSDDAYVVAMGLLYKAGAYDVILNNAEVKTISNALETDSKRKLQEIFKDKLTSDEYKEALSKALNLSKGLSELSKTLMQAEKEKQEIMEFADSLLDHKLVQSKSDSEVTEWKIRKCNARLHHNYYEQTGYEVLQCAMEAGHKCQHWAIDAQGERINWNATIIQGLSDSDKVAIITDDAI